jgi:hypothetical protein
MRIIPSNFGSRSSLSFSIQAYWYKRKETLGFEFEDSGYQIQQALITGISLKPGHTPCNTPLVDPHQLKDGERERERLIK